MARTNFSDWTKWKRVSRCLTNHEVIFVQVIYTTKSGSLGILNILGSISHIGKLYWCNFDEWGSFFLFWMNTHFSKTTVSNSSFFQTQLWFICSSFCLFLFGNVWFWLGLISSIWFCYCSVLSILWNMASGLFLFLLVWNIIKSSCIMSA